MIVISYVNKRNIIIPYHTQNKHKQKGHNMTQQVLCAGSDPTTFVRERVTSIRKKKALVKESCHCSVCLISCRTIHACLGLSYWGSAYPCISIVYKSTHGHTHTHMHTHTDQENTEFHTCIYLCSAPQGSCL